LVCIAVSESKYCRSNLGQTKLKTDLIFPHGETAWPTKIAQELVEKFALMYGTRNIKSLARHGGINSFCKSNGITTKEIA
jgi:hypothetical protein